MVLDNPVVIRFCVQWILSSIICNFSQVHRMNEQKHVNIKLSNWKIMKKIQLHFSWNYKYYCKIEIVNCRFPFQVFFLFPLILFVVLPSVSEIRKQYLFIRTHFIFLFQRVGLSFNPFILFIYLFIFIVLHNFFLNIEESFRINKIFFILIKSIFF